MEWRKYDRSSACWNALTAAAATAIIMALFIVVIIVLHLIVHCFSAYPWEHACVHSDECDADKVHP